MWKNRKKMQSVSFTLLYVCVFFVKWAHSFLVGGGGQQTESSPTQMQTIIKHLMIMKKWHSRQLQDVMYVTMASHSCTITLMQSTLKQSRMNACNLSGAPHLILPPGHVDWETRDFGRPLCKVSWQPMGRNANHYILMHHLISRSSFSRCGCLLTSRADRSLQPEKTHVLSTCSQFIQVQNWSILLMATLSWTWGCWNQSQQCFDGRRVGSRFRQVANSLYH